ncbi:hypothetical protein F2Q68_00037862 [Brassica cretica]|uniref:Uncharacterized protein n=1 Tax=Brassica cretica TaxID=69181 RepID=A0A8S9H1H6_BRACR|nr:hypothetical protein F2Q68_00037862 [Brassica cretica]
MKQELCPQPRASAKAILLVFRSKETDGDYSKRLQLMTILSSQVLDAASRGSDDEEGTMAHQITESRLILTFWNKVA